MYTIIVNMFAAKILIMLKNYYLIRVVEFDVYFH